MSSPSDLESAKAAWTTPQLQIAGVDGTQSELGAASDNAEVSASATTPNGS